AAIAARRTARGRALADRARSAVGRERERPLGEPWSCECGQSFLVAGVDRHRIYWLPDASPDDPVLSGRCPNCDRPLPSESSGARAA
ncbi:MAG TPA: hypothetical protein VN213_06115, partial [Solirubrobacteraceae bacterium]|nr:hypothetical protein [Solirubrobacteraceae bacterium]